VTHGHVHTARSTHRRRQSGLRLALAAVLCSSLAAAQEASPSAAPASNPDVGRPGSALPKLPAARRVSPAAQQTPADDRWLAWTAIGAGTALLVASGWQWVVFANENAEAGDLCRAQRGGLARCADAEDRARYVSARDDAKHARVLAAILGGLGAASLVTGILLLPDHDSGSAQPRVAFSADPFAGEARASLYWAW
jgi:hypothetical protein